MSTRTPNTHAGNRIPCTRCAMPCIVAADRSADARMAAHADGAGVCPNCLVACFLKSPPMDTPVRMAMERVGMDFLRSGHVQSQFGVVLRAGLADLDINQIDWDEVAANWDLPIDPKSAKGEPPAGGGLFA
jgi:hypothetical protein